MSGETRTAVLAAVAGNVLLSLTKFVAAVFSGSAAMLSEAIHSLVDTANDGLLLYGLRQSARAPDERHPFGYGHEAYFWTLLAGMMFLMLGGGMSIFNGLQRLHHPVPPQNLAWTYAVLAVALVFEGTSWYFGWRAFRAERRGRGILETIHNTKNPTTFAVLLEDTAALIGLAFAFAGIFAAARLHAPWIDGASSVVIGVLLCAVALIMVYESKGLLVGEGVERHIARELRDMVLAQSAVERVNKLATLYLGPEEVVLAIDLRFRPETALEELRATLAQLRRTIRARYPRIRRIFVDLSSIEG